MSQKPVHTDILFVLLQDAINQAESGLITTSEFLDMVRPINIELQKRIIGEHSELKQSIDGLNSRIENIEKFQSDYRESSEAMINDYDDFLLSKGLDEEFEEFCLQRVEARSGGVNNNETDFF